MARPVFMNTESEQKEPEKTEELSRRIAELEDVRRANLNLLDDIEEERENIIAAKAKDEARFESVVEGLIAVDNERKIMAVNKAAVDILGWKTEELIGHIITDLPIDDETGNLLSLANRPTSMALATGETVKVNCFFIRKDNTKIPIAITAAPIKLAGGVIGLIEIVRDMTRENELDQVKNEFISIASHQLRTPLTGIQWVVERFTKKEKLTPKGEEYLQDIHSSAKHLTELVDLLLNLSRIEGGKIGVTPETLELIGFIRSFLDETVPLQDKKGVKIIFEDHPAELAISADKTALRNIVQSLVSNAIEYTPAGGGIDITLKKKDESFLIKIQDTGIGIPRAEQAHIFEKFMRASNAKLYKTDGTGIGLYIAERSAQLLNGKIWFESEENKGSTFYIEIPLEFKPREGQTPPP